MLEKIKSFVPLELNHLFKSNLRAPIGHLLLTNEASGKGLYQIKLLAQEVPWDPPPPKKPRLLLRLLFFSSQPDCEALLLKTAPT